MRTADTEAEDFNASGYGPMHDRLRDLYDNYLRARPDLSADQCFAMAWRDLSLGDRNEIRAEESGEAQLFANINRAAGRGKEDTTMKHMDQVRNLTKAVSGVFADAELTSADREDILRDVFDDYRKRTGRDGIADIASVRAPTQIEAQALKNIDGQGLAMELLNAKAEALRKAQPHLSREQAFARVYSDPANAEVANIERASSRDKLTKTVAKQDAPTMQQHLHVAARDGAIDEIWKRADELRRHNPALSRSQSFAKAYQANPLLAARERQAARAALYC